MRLNKGCVLFWAVSSLLALQACQGLDDGSSQNTTVVEGSANTGDSAGAWHNVLSLKGENSKTSQVFNITGNEWKISWQATAPKGREDEFIIILFDKANPDISEIIVNEVGNTKDYVYLQGQGKFYLMVTTSQQYQIDIQEQR